MLLHGVLGYVGAFDGLVQALAPSRRVLVLEMPGYGRSAPLEGKYDFARVNTMLEDALLARGVRECAVVAHSAGAYRALLLTLGRRVEVTHLVTLGGVAGFDAPVRAAFHGLAQQLRDGLDMKAMILDLVTAPGFAARNPEDARAIVAAVAAARMDVVAAEYDAIADAEDLRPRLHDLPCGVTARVGAMDKATPVEWSADIVKRAPNAVLQVVEGVAHCLLQEDGAATIASVKMAIGA